jgi:hypothetical protein
MFSTLSSLTSLVKKEEPVQVVEAKSAASDFDGIRSVVEDSLADLQDKVEALMKLAKETGAIKLDTVKDKDGHTVFKKIEKLCADAQQIKKLMVEAEAMIMQVAEGQVDQDEALLEADMKYVLCHMKGDKCVGFYVADDQPVSKSVDKAHVYTSKAAAAKAAKLRNDQSGLKDDESFVVRPKFDEALETLGTLLEGKDYSDSAEFTEEFYGMISKVNDIKRIVKAPRFMNWMKVTDHNFDTTCVEGGKAVVAAVDALHSAVNDLENQLDTAA